MTYEQSGVSIDAGDRMVGRIAGAVASTHGPRVINLENGFAGFFRLDYGERLLKKNYKNPVLVACTDGVGTKIKIGQMINRYDTVGIDLVAMSVNDMIVHGAEPLFFLDYLAVNKLDPQSIAQMVEGVAAGCKQANCALIGGETAEMPDIYRKGEFDMAGFAVGVVEKGRIITGANMQKGDVILGLASNGLHSNGYSLVRNICFKQLKLKGKILAIMDGCDESISRVSRNISSVKLVRSSDVTAYDIIRNKSLLVTKTAYTKLIERLQGNAAGPRKVKTSSAKGAKKVSQAKDAAPKKDQKK